MAGVPPSGVKTRAALLAGARAVFERDGYAAAKIADISAAAGVATGSFYTHFKTKAEVLAAVLDESRHELLHPSLDEGAGEADPVARIRRANEVYLDAYARNAGLMALIEHVQAVDPEFRALRAERAEFFHARNARAIRRLQRDGLADRGVDARIAGAALSRMVSRMAYEAFVLRPGSVPRKRLLDQLTRLWVNALRIEQP